MELRKLHLGRVGLSFGFSSLGVRDFAAGATRISTLSSKQLLTA